MTLVYEGLLLIYFQYNELCVLAESMAALNENTAKKFLVICPTTKKAAF